MTVLTWIVAAVLVGGGIVLTLSGNSVKANATRRDHVYQRGERLMVGGYLVFLAGLALSLFAAGLR
jgi:hypothetical protein